MMRNLRNCRVFNTLFVLNLKLYILGRIKKKDDTLQKEQNNYARKQSLREAIIKKNREKGIAEFSK